MLKFSPQIKQAVILCGGLGSRLRPLTDHCPKPMVDVNGRPFLAYLIEQLKDNGIERVLLLTGYLGHVIVEHFGNGETFGLPIEYSQGAVEWDTGRRIFEAREQLAPVFLLLYSDNFIHFSMRHLEAQYVTQKRPLCLTLARKKSGNIHISNDGKIDLYDKSRTGADLNFVEIGYMIVQKDILSLDRPDFPASFSDKLAELVAQHQVSGLIYPGDYYSVSDVPRLEITRHFLQRKKILLIDRDGIVNKKAPRAEYITDWNSFEFLPENIEGLRLLAQAGFSFIVITNQAGIARKMMTREAVDEINARMCEVLRKESINVIDVFVCPHHWDERCDCRKPMPGLLFQASKKHGVRLDKTYFIGDDPRDCQTASRANGQSIFIGDKANLRELEIGEMPDACFDTVKEAAPFVLQALSEDVK